MEKNEHIRKEPKSNKRLLKIIEIISVIALIVTLIICVLFGIDYNNYKAGNRSVYFGTLDNYSKNQTMRFGSLDLKVNSVTLKPYPKPTPLAQTDCSVFDKPYTSISGRLSSYPTVESWECMATLQEYPILESHYKSKQEIIVEFEYSSTSKNPINLLDYKVQIVANTALENYDHPSKACTGMAPNHAFLKGYTERECIVKTIDKGYEGPLALSVRKSGKEKIINLSISK